LALRAARRAGPGPRGSGAGADWPGARLRGGRFLFARGLHAGDLGEIRALVSDTSGAFAARPMADFVFGLALAERIGIPAELHHHWCGIQIEGLAKHIGQVAAVGIWHALDLVAVHDDAGRIAATLMDVAQLDTFTMHQRRLMRLAQAVDSYRVAFLGLKKERTENSRPDHYSFVGTQE
jgi:hypothetical protein